MKIPYLFLIIVIFVGTRVCAQDLGTFKELKMIPDKARILIIENDLPKANNLALVKTTFADMGFNINLNQSNDNLGIVVSCLCHAARHGFGSVYIKVRARVDEGAIQLTAVGVNEISDLDKPYEVINKGARGSAMRKQFAKLYEIGSAIQTQGINFGL